MTSTNQIYLGERKYLCHKIDHHIFRIFFKDIKTTKKLKYNIDKKAENYVKITKYYILYLWRVFGRYYTDNDVFLADNIVLADISVLVADIMTFFTVRF